MTIRKQHITLIELLVALGLLSLLIFVLFGSFRTMEWMGRKSEELETEAFQLRYTQHRLGQVLPKAMVHEFGNNEQDSYFCTSQQSNAFLKPNSLIFCFKNIGSPQPHLNGLMLSRLYVDGENRLCLAFWTFPDPKATSLSVAKRKEVLLGGVEEISFSFYVPPSPVEKKVQTENVITGNQKEDPEPDHWHSEWKRSYRDMPVLMKLTVRRSNGKAIEYAFPLPYAKKQIKLRQAT